MYYRWRREFGSPKSDQVRRMKDLEIENIRPRRAVADLIFDKLILHRELPWYGRARTDDAVQSETTLYGGAVELYRAHLHSAVHECHGGQPSQRRTETLPWRALRGRRTQARHSDCYQSKSDHFPRRHTGGRDAMANRSSGKTVAQLVRSKIPVRSRCVGHDVIRPMIAEGIREATITIIAIHATATNPPTAIIRKISGSIRRLDSRL